ncbi:MAG: sialidase family protein [Candidatus Latescibacterota bacterium]
MRKTFEPLCGTVYAYATFGIGSQNPLPASEGGDRGTILITLMGAASESAELLPVVRFGLADGGRRDPGNTQLVPWVSDGRIGYFGDHGRPNTRYTMRIRIGIAESVMDVHVRAEGEEKWFPLAKGVATEYRVEEVCEARIDRAPDAEEVADFYIGNEVWPEGERVRPYRFAKPDRTVGPDGGFRFQSRRSFWTERDHVTVARTEAHWFGFPDLVQTRSGKLICTYTEGVGHGGGPRVLIRESGDLGRTWGEPREIGSGKCNTSRIQQLRDDTLLHIYDLYPGNPVLQTSTDDGATWTDRRELDPEKAGGRLCIVPSRVLEMEDGFWLLAGSTWFPPSNHECIEIYHSPDRGITWALWSAIEDYPPHSLSEPSLVALPDGRLVCYMREERGDGLPGCKAYSADEGRTWSELEELPFAVTGRTCAELLSDGRVLLTFRSGIGRPDLWAWVDDQSPCAGPKISGAHYDDSTSVGLLDDALHIDHDGRRGQSTIYYLRPPETLGAAIDLTAELRVIANGGCAATIGIPHAGKVRFFSDRVEMAHDPGIGFPIDATRFHVYRIHSRDGRLRILADDQLKLDTDRLCERRARSYYNLPWTNNERDCPQWLVDPGRDNRWWIYDVCLTFGNEVDSDAPMAPACAVPAWLDQKGQVLIEPTHFYTPQITPRSSGSSVWKRVECLVQEKDGAVCRTSWTASRDGFPDQYQLDHVLEVEATNWGTDQGYSGWAQLADGRILVLNYTDDTALVNQPAGYWGRSWIRGTWLTLRDLDV